MFHISFQLSAFSIQRSALSVPFESRTKRSKIRIAIQASRRQMRTQSFNNNREHHSCSIGIRALGRKDIFPASGTRCWDNFCESAIMKHSRWRSHTLVDNHGGRGAPAALNGKAMFLEFLFRR